MAKISRGHERDLADVAAMLERGLVTRDRLREAFASIADEIYRYPSLDAASFEAAVEGVLT